MALAVVRYLVFALVAILGPGVAVQRLLGLRVDASVVVPAGCAVVAASYWLGSRLGLPWLAPLIVIALDAVLVFRGLGRRAPSDPSLRGVLPAAAALVLMLALTQYGWNRPGAGGGFELDPMGDQPLHVGMTYELTLPWPPQVPGLAGVPLRYHLGSDLVRAAALRFADVNPFDAIQRFQVTLSAIALALAMRAATARLGAPAAAVGLSGFSLLATDLSFLLALFLPVTFWADLLRGNLLLSLSGDNSLVLGLALALAALVCLSRYEGGEGRGWLVLAAGLAAATPAFKVFTAAQLALGLWWIAARGPHRGARALLAAVTTAGLALQAGGSDAGLVRLELAPLAFVRDSIRNIGLPEPAGATLVLWVVPWLALSLGLRVLGLGEAFRALRERGSLGAALAVFAFSGWPVAMLLHASARDLQGNRLTNAFHYLTEGSGCVLWIFTAIAVARIGLRATRPVLVTALAAALALPATLEFVWRRIETKPDTLSPALVGGMAALRRDSRPGDIVLQRPGWERPAFPVILAGRRVIFEGYSPYLTQFAPEEELRRRRERLVRFFRSTDAEEARRIAAEIGASHLCLYEGQTLPFGNPGWLRAIWDDREVRVFRIERNAATGRD